MASIAFRGSARMSKVCRSLVSSQARCNGTDSALYLSSWGGELKLRVSARSRAGQGPVCPS